MRRDRSPASALVLTVLVVGLIVSLALSSAVVRFGQLTTVDKTNSAIIAGLAADIGVREASINPDYPVVKDIDSQSPSAHTDNVTSYKPNVRHSAYSITNQTTTLPRCYSVAVLAPWVNDGYYLFDDNSTTNPALIFNNANIINNTRLNDTSPNSPNVTSLNNQMVSDLSGMGGFFNPFATTTNTSDPTYWIIKAGGPWDQFYKYSDKNTNEIRYGSLDILYAPYLPKFVDTGSYINGTDGYGKRTTDEMQARFETIIKSNNMKLWIDVSPEKTEYLYRYGLADLFNSGADANNNKLVWNQPKTYNSTPEVDNTGPYVTTGDVSSGNNTATWDKKATNSASPSGSGWNMSIAKATQAMLYLTSDNPATSPTMAITIDKNSGSYNTYTYKFKYYGELTGIKVYNGMYNFNFYDANGSPITIPDLGTTIMGAITNIDTSASKIEFKLAVLSPTSSPITINPSVISITNGSENHAADGTKVKVLDPGNITISGNNANTGLGGISCVSNTFPGTSWSTVCPSKGDIIYLTNTSYPSGGGPVWGVVKTVTYTSSTKVTGVTVDSWRQQPLPNKEVAVASGLDGGSWVALYGGIISRDLYLADLGTVNNDLWFYNPDTNAWKYKAATGTAPPPLAGATLSYYNSGGSGNLGKLILYGGYYYQARRNPSKDYPFTDLLYNDYANTAGNRMARIINNDVYSYDIGNSRWDKISVNNPTIDTGGSSINLKLVTLSRFNDRNGYELWKPTTSIKTTFDSDHNINLIHETNDSGQQTTRPFGFSLGDMVNLIAKKDGNTVNVKSTVTSVSNFSQTIKVAESDLSGVTDISRVIVEYRPNNYVTCQYNGSHFCRANQASDLAGVAVGDLVAAYNMKGDGSGVDIMSYGYINSIDYTTNDIHFYPNEYRLNEGYNGNDAINDCIYYTAPAFCLGTYDTGLTAAPAPRYGHSAYINGNNLYVWQGSSGDYQYTQGYKRSALYPNVAWKLDLTRPDLGWSMVNSGALEKASSGSSLGGINILRGTGFPRLNLTQTSGDNASCSDVDVTDGFGNTIGASKDTFCYLMANDDLAKKELRKNASVTLYANETSGLTTFTGTVIDVINDDTLKIKINPGLLNNLGTAFGTETNSFYVNLQYNYLDPNFDGSSLSFDGDKIKITTNDSSKIDNLRAYTIGTEVIIKKNGCGGYYTGTVSDRSIDGNVMTLTFREGMALNMPVPNGYVGGAGIGNTLYSYSSFSTNCGSGTYGPIEWKLDTGSGGWLTQSASNTRPVPRLYDAVVSDGASNFMVGGVTGVWPTVWKQTGTNWNQMNSSNEQSKDIPNSNSPGLGVYKVNDNGDIKTKLVYFPGLNPNGQYPVFTSYPSTTSTFYGVSDYSGMPTGYDIDNFYPLGKITTNSSVSNVLQNITPPDNNKSFSLLYGTDNNTKPMCTFVGQTNPYCEGFSYYNIGGYGRFSLSSAQTSSIKDSTDASSLGAGSGTAVTSAVIVNPGTNFRYSGTDTPTMLMSAATRYDIAGGSGWLATQDGYQPYLLSNGSVDTNSDKTIMLAGVGKLANSNAYVMVTTMGIGSALMRGSQAKYADPTRKYSYCGKYKFDTDQRLYVCDAAVTSSPNNYLSYLPDGEDIAFMFNASRYLADAGTYRITGYYGGVRKAYIVTFTGSSTSDVPKKMEEVAP